MQRQLLTIYPHLKPEQVHVTGTPQFDYHFAGISSESRRTLRPHGSGPQPAVHFLHDRHGQTFPGRTPPRALHRRPLQTLDIDPPAATAGTHLCQGRATR